VLYAHHDAVMVTEVPCVILPLELETTIMSSDSKAPWYVPETEPSEHLLALSVLGALDSAGPVRFPAEFSRLVDTDVPDAHDEPAVKQAGAV